MISCPKVFFNIGLPTKARNSSKIIYYQLYDAPISLQFQLFNISNESRARMALSSFFWRIIWFNCNRSLSWTLRNYLMPFWSSSYLLICEKCLYRSGCNVFLWST
jgi:hypothetical protein